MARRRTTEVATLVERSTRYLILVKIASKDSETVINALIKHARKLPQEFYKLLQNGKAMCILVGVFIYA